jgi:hypothetical protein
MTFSFLYVDLTMPVQAVCRNCDDIFDHLVIGSSLFGTFLSLMMYYLFEKHFEWIKRYLLYLIVYG